MSGEDAMYELTVNLSTLPKGEPVQIVGLGTFENGSTYTVSKEEAEKYRSYHSTQEETRDDKGNVVGSKVVEGPTLLQAADTMHGIEVDTVKAKTSTSSSPSKPAQEQNKNEGGAN